MISGKFQILLVGLVVLTVALRGSSAQTTNGTKGEGAPVTEVTTQQTENQEASTSTEQPSRILTALRLEIERRRKERKQREQERREQILSSLDGLSDRKREFELRRQQAQANAEEAREARRQEMEARRAGRLPARERERINRQRLALLAEQTAQEENEIENDSLPVLDDVVETQDADVDLMGGGGGQRVRNLLLIEESDGNLRLIDLDTEEGQRFLRDEAKQRAEGEANGSDQQTAEQVPIEASLKLKTGQL
ncbi:ensconsin-like [Anopheles aquasalis]|uniref:ensconsin-like n=1 Tax=Anopheles aquasalis TaxID=42839 RepID=UPI00215A69F5|nr:ensconsin-like [Anopheles aquasalis]